MTRTRTLTRLVHANPNPNPNRNPSQAMRSFRSPELVTALDDGFAAQATASST